MESYLSGFYRNALAFGAVLVLWYGVYRSKKLRRQTRELWSPDTYTELQDDGEVVTHIVSSPEAEKPKESRISTLHHILKLLTYCKHYWPWFFAGFIFLSIYSVARVFQPSYTAQVITNIVNIKQMSDLVNSVLTLGALCLVSSICSGFRGGLFDCKFLIPLTSAYQVFNFQMPLL